MATIYPMPSPVFSRRDSPAINYNRPIIFQTKSTDEYFAFTPYAQIAFNLEGTYWLTLEHYIQAKRFEGHSPTVDAIKKIKRPQEISSFVEEDETARFLNGDWDKRKCEYMYQGLFAKLSQNEEVLSQLLRTETRFLRYKNGSDFMWGIGDDTTGHNYLGRLLCYVRTYLQWNPSSRTPPTYKYSDLPDNRVAHTLSTPYNAVTSTLTSYDDVIHFGDKDKRYFELCNDSKHDIVLNEVLWMTVTHYYLAQKFQGNVHLQNTIAAFESPTQARQYANTQISHKIRDFHAKRDTIMQCALNAKFSKHPSLVEMLCSTHPKLLMFDCSEDSYWGIGRDSKGQNRLGLMLTDVRKRLYQPSHSYLHTARGLAYSSNDIYFFDPESEYYEFTPNSLHWIKLDGKRWRTVSHYFQAQKFRTRSEIVNAIENSATAKEAWDIAHNRDYVKSIPISFMNERDDIMEKAMRAKMEQNEDVCRLLKATGEKRLIFSGEDLHWGTGHDRTGENLIGKILMNIRRTLPSIPSTPRITSETYKPYSKPLPPVSTRVVSTATGPILFFNDKDHFYPLTTFSVYQFKVSDCVYRSLNHYFQAQKFTTSPDIHRSIVNAPTPLEALKISQENSKSMIPDFNANRTNVMEIGLKARFDQNPSLQELLMETGNRELILNNERDTYWGIGDGTGTNHFGKLLKKIREQFNTKSSDHPSSTSPRIHTYDTEPIDYPLHRPMPMPVMTHKHVYLDTVCEEPATSFIADRDNSVILAKNAKGDTIVSFCDPSMKYPSSLCSDEEHLYVITEPTLIKINKITGKKIIQIYLPIAKAKVTHTRDAVRVFDQRSSIETVYTTDLVKH